MPTLMVAVAVATTCCAIARILLYRLHPGMAGLGHWAWASIIGALSFAAAGSVSGEFSTISLSLTHALIALGFCLVWDGFRRFLGRGGLPLAMYIGFGSLVLTLIAVSNVIGSMGLRAGFNSCLIAFISAAIAKELLWKPPSQRLAMRLAGWIYAVNAALFVIRALSLGLDFALRDGSMSYGLTAAVTLWWLCVTVSVTLCMILMAGERLQEELNEQASRDPLTGIYNRRAFSSLAEKEVARARRNHQPLAVLMMDLDHFKQVNDLLGHSGGDEALCRFVAVVGGHLRSEDLFCRFGGEEFLALLPGSTDAQALIVAERVRTVFADDASQTVKRATDLPFRMTVSVGIGELAENEDLEGLIHRADTALYAAKAAGRNCCLLAVPPAGPESGGITVPA